MAKDVEKLRKRYMPKSKVSVLFVGESPPKMNFFYQRSGPLYRAIRDAFCEVFGRQKDFLNFFRAKDCWLADLFEEKGKRVKESKREEIEERVEKLAELVRNKRPEVVVAVIKGIAGYVKKAVRCSHVRTRFRALPFPTYQKEYFVRDLKGILEELEARRGARAPSQEGRC